MKEERKLQDQLKKLNTPNELKEKIYSNWEEQLTSSIFFESNYKVKVFAVAASFVFVFSSWFMFDSTPAVVYAALDDVVNEEKHEGYSVSVDNIANDFKIKVSSALKSAGMVLEMTKYCTLEKNEMLHLQLANSLKVEAEEGNVHVFLSENKISPALWQSYDGVFLSQKNKNVTWEILHPRRGLYVLILFDAKTQSKSIREMTKKMFYT